MRHNRCHILHWLLSLALVLTGQAAAAAHGAPGPSGQIELCTGAGPVMVYVDESGKPVGDPVYCPEFALSLILALDVAPGLPVPVTAEHGVDQGARAVVVRLSCVPFAHPARAPPRAV